jgi:DNA replicative helicase MCM subunit Mcm2 (Cdc46/Mcm family)
LQAEISGKESETFSHKPFSKENELSTSRNKDTEKALKLPVSRVSVNKSPKKDQKSIFLDFLEAAGGKMKIEELRQKYLEEGVNTEKFDMILKTLMETGEIYSPESGIIKLV